MPHVTAGAAHGRQMAAALHLMLSGRAPSPASAHDAQSTGRAIRATPAHGSGKGNRERLHGSVLLGEAGHTLLRGKQG